VNNSEGRGGFHYCAFFRWSAGCDLGAEGRSNAFLAAALLRVVRDVVPIQAPASPSVVLSASVRGVDTGARLNAVGAGRVVANAAACRDDFDLVRPPCVLLWVDLLSFRL